MSEEPYSCAALLEEVKDKKIAFYHFKTFAEEIAEQKSYQAKRTKAKADWQAEIIAAERRALEKVDLDFTLCTKCVVERSDK